MKEKQTPEKAEPRKAEAMSGEDMSGENKPGEKKSETSWADEAAKARTAGDPRARTPTDEVGEPSIRSFEE